MAAFDYVAVDEAGRTVRGTLTAVDDGSVRALLARRRLMPLDVTASRGAVRNSDTPARKGGVLGRFGPARGGLDPRTLALVTRQLATLVTVSPVEEALRAIACTLPSRPSVAGERLWEREAGEHELAQ